MFASEVFLKSLQPRRPRNEPATVVSVRHTVSRPGGDVVFDARPDVGVGGQLWEAALVLADHVEGTMRGKRVLELGSGTGALGLCIALMEPARVVLSDRFDVLPLLRANVDANPHLATLVSVQEISWGEPVPCNDNGVAAPDCIVASEVIYNGLLYDKLLHTVRLLSDRHTRLVMSFERRSSEDRWLSMMRDNYESVVLIEKPNTQTGRVVHIMECDCLRTQ